MDKLKIDWFWVGLWGLLILMLIMATSLSFALLDVRDLEKENFKLVSQVEVLQSAIGNRLEVGYSCLEITDPERQVKIMERMLAQGYKLDRFELYMKPTLIPQNESQENQ